MPGRGEIAASLRKRIVSGDYPVGTRMPSTREIVSEFGSSRATAGAALRVLAEQGFVSLRDKSTAVVLSSEQTSRAPQACFAQVAEELAALRGELIAMRQRADEAVARVAVLVEMVEACSGSTES